MIQVVRKSPLSGETNSMILAITEDQIEAYENGALLQNAFPNLNADEREFFKTGISLEEQKSIFGE